MSAKEDEIAAAKKRARARRRRLRGRKKKEPADSPSPSADTPVPSASSSEVIVRSGDSSGATRSGSSSATGVTAGARIAALHHQIPDEILHDAHLIEALAVLPSNYNFELPKTVWRLREAGARCVALQFPEGLLMYACVISDILTQFVPTLEDSIIMGDVTYGACCVDDLSAKALGADFLVHYGHSCLVPIDVSSGVRVLYVFVDIRVDVDHFVDSVVANFGAGNDAERMPRLVVAGTIQFASSMEAAATELRRHFDTVLVPQARPLSKGEVLGCTAPKLEFEKEEQERETILVFLADGRFHLESIMIQNPHSIDRYFKYDPYSKKLTLEEYDHEEMHRIRRDAIARASQASKFGLILGTLGRQGNPNILADIEQILQERGIPFIKVLLSEVFPQKLALFQDVEAWVQVACPRLSIDWGYAFGVPLLSSYEAHVALKTTEWQEVYPMDYYRRDGGSWANYAQEKRAQDQEARRKRRKHVLVQESEA